MGLVGIGWDLPERYALVGQKLAQGGFESFLCGLQHEVADRGMHSSTLAQDSSKPGARTNATSGNPSILSLFLHTSRTRPARVRTSRCSTARSRQWTVLWGRSWALERFGLRDNTIVVFTTHHSIAFPRANGTLYDPGLRTTLLFRWPGGLEGGRTVSELTSNVDPLPTLLDAAAIETPADGQGRSFLDLLRGEEFAARTGNHAEQNTVPVENIDALFRYGGECGAQFLCGDGVA
jgi:hypothetical protein